MPYRRLLNTDQVRIRMLKAVVVKDDIYNVYDSAVSLKTLTNARNFLVRSEATQAYYAEYFECQSEAGRGHQSNVKIARLYISHFIQVLDLAVIRSEIRTAHKECYSLDVRSNNVPDLPTGTALVEWGRKIAGSENRRTSQDGIPTYSPTIAKVRVHRDTFMESYEKQKNLQALTTRSLEMLVSVRTETDVLILNTWNQVEQKYAGIISNGERLDLCCAYGLIYYYRTGEKEEIAK